MYRVGAAKLGDSQDLADIQIGFPGGGRADMVCLIGFPHVERGAVDVGEDRDRGNAHLAAGANDAHCNLSAVGNQNLLEHKLRRIIVKEAGRGSLSPA